MIYKYSARGFEGIIPCPEERFDSWSVIQPVT